MVLLFNDQKSQRLDYILNEVFVLRGQLSFETTDNWDDFVRSEAGIKIVYTQTEWLKNGSFLQGISTLQTQKLSGFLYIPNGGFLFETTTRDWGWTPSNGIISVTASRHPLPFDTLEGLFISENTQEIGFDHLCFDVFAHIFWCISRYEEYQWANLQSLYNANEGKHFLIKSHSFPPDQHARFQAKYSHLANLGWLDIPIVDKAMAFLFSQLGCTIPRKASTSATADIDMALRFGGRSFARYLASTVQDLVTRPILLADRLAVLFGKIDPYHPLKFTIPLLAGVNNSKVFFLLSNKRTQHNKQISLDNRQLASAISGAVNALGANATGFHPSYQIPTTYTNPGDVWGKELDYLTQYTGEKALHARLHYINLHFPSSYRNLNQLGIEHDWSMGYPEAVGFRAGTSFPFSWYDLVAEKSTRLLVHPFCIMDVTCKLYLGLSPSESIALGEKLKMSIHALGGDFCFIFHNESVCECFPWKGWGSVINKWLKP